MEHKLRIPSLETTVKGLKETIHSFLNAPKLQQRLVFNGDELKDHKRTLESYGLVNGSQLYLSVGHSLNGHWHTENTKITMADGTEKLLSEVQAGDTVLSYDLEKKDFCTGNVLERLEYDDK